MSGGLRLFVMLLGFLAAEYAMAMLLGGTELMLQLPFRYHFGMTLVASIFNYALLDLLRSMEPFRRR